MNKYKSIKRIDNRQGHTCTGCAGSFSAEKCLEIGLFIEYSDDYLPPCEGSDGVIYVRSNEILKQIDDLKQEHSKFMDNAEKISNDIDELKTKMETLNE